MSVYNTLNIKFTNCLDILKIHIYIKYLCIIYIHIIYIYIYTYTYIYITCSSSYHHNDFMATGPLGHIHVWLWMWVCTIMCLTVMGDQGHQLL